jgi:hypothetical protein|uniref:Uncharacterized protein n=2 Tax=Zea mays TaxID=4577 RepID=A0A804QKW6_MAIZE
MVTASSFCWEMRRPRRVHLLACLVVLAVILTSGPFVETSMARMMIRGVDPPRELLPALAVVVAAEADDGRRSAVKATAEGRGKREVPGGADPQHH